MLHAILEKYLYQKIISYYNSNLTGSPVSYLATLKYIGLKKNITFRITILIGLFWFVERYSDN